MDAQRFKDLACTSMSSGSKRRIAPSHESFCGNPSCDTVVITFQVQQLTRFCIRQGAMPDRLLFAKQQARTADVVISHVHCKASANASMLFNKTRCAYAEYAYAFCCWTIIRGSAVRVIAPNGFRFSGHLGLGCFAK